MGKRIRLLILAGTVSATFCASASAPADIIVQQLPYPWGGPGSDTLFRDPFSQIAWQQTADNFLISAPATIRQVSWWGLYGGSEMPVTPPPPVETMRVRFYPARAGDGLPDDDNILLEEYHMDVVRAATGDTVHVGGNPPEYHYQVELDTPLSLDSTTLYWLEIVQIGNVDSAFRWESGYGIINGHAYRNSIGDYWRISASSQAFELSTVPEPSSAFFLFLVIAFMIRCRSHVRCNCLPSCNGSRRSVQ